MEQIFVTVRDRGLEECNDHMTEKQEDAEPKFMESATIARTLSLDTG